jgi:hypothetical protein
LRRLADDPRVGALASDLRWDLPLRLLAGLHYLVLGGEATWDGADDVLDARAGWLGEFVATQPVQTNEVQRAWALLPGLLSVGAPRLDLLELGCSAGLLLGLDRFAYRYRHGAWGSGELVLSGDDRGGPPASLLARGIEVVRRRGVDRRPVDATSGDGARLLEAFLWPGQDERVERLRRAIAAARAEPPELIAGDYVEQLPVLLADRRDDAQLVVITSVTAGYLTSEQHASLTAGLAGVHWLSLDHVDRGYVGLRLTLDGRPLAEHVDPHGTALRWV